MDFVGPSLRELARRVGCSPGQLSHAARGRRGLSARLAGEVAAQLGCRPDQVIAYLRAMARETSTLADVRRVRRLIEGQVQYRYRAAVSLRADGRDAVFSREIIDCVPLPGRTVRVATFHETSISPTSDSRAEPPTVEVLDGPARYQIEARGSGVRVAFPGGWTARDRHLHLRVRSRVANAFTDGDEPAGSDPIAAGLPRLVGCASFVARGLVDELALSVDLGPAHAPRRWVGAWAWFWTAPIWDVPDNLIDAGVCRSWTFTHAASSALLTVSEPLPVYSLAIVWEHEPKGGSR